MRDLASVIKQTPKVTLSLINATKAYKGRRGIAPPILNVGTI